MTNNDITFNFTSYGEDFVLILREGQTYTNGRLALEFWTEQEWGMEPFAKVTTNMPEVHLNPGEVLVKDWAENAPLVEALTEAGWLISTGREVLSGFVVPQVMRLGGPIAHLA